MSTTGTVGASSVAARHARDEVCVDENKVGTRRLREGDTELMPDKRTEFVFVREAGKTPLKQSGWLPTGHMFEKYKGGGVSVCIICGWDPERLVPCAAPKSGLRCVPDKDEQGGYNDYRTGVDQLASKK